MIRLLGLIGASVMLLTACGGSSSVATTEQTAQPSATPPPSTTVTSEPAQTDDAPELGGTSWSVVSYRLPNGSITNVWKTDVTISFAADGTLTGSAGCNDYVATWVVSGPYDDFESGVPDPNDGQGLTFVSLFWTEVSCDDESIMEQEAEILDLLQQGARWVLIRESFHLRNGDGSFLFEAAAQ